MEEQGPLSPEFFAPTQEDIVLKRLIVTVAITGILGALLAACGDPPGSIWVDDDGLVALNNCNATTPGPATIQAGIDAAADNAIVRVCPGVYHGDVNVNHPVKLYGARMGVDARTRTITPANESKVTTDTSPGPCPNPVDCPAGTDPTGRIKVTSPDVIVDGFLFESNGPAAGLYVAPNTPSSAPVDNVTVLNNAFQANTIGLYLNGHGEDAVISVQKNRFFYDNIPAGSAAGNGIYSDQGLSAADISNNGFEHNVNGGILFAQTASPVGPDVSNVTITHNSSANDATFVGLFGTHHNIKIRDNTVTDTDTSDDANQGSQIFIGGESGGAPGSPNGVLVSGNTLTKSPANGIAVRDSSSNVDVIMNNSSSATGAGISVSSTANGAASEVRSNTMDNNATYGIEFRAGTSSTFITGNHATGNGTFDCFDATMGRQRALVKNIWRTDNIGNTSSPATLCHP
jgi:hypothetical protein